MPCLALLALPAARAEVGPVFCAALALGDDVIHRVRWLSAVGAGVVLLVEHGPADPVPLCAVASVVPGPGVLPCWALVYGTASFRHQGGASRLGAYGEGSPHLSRTMMVMVLSSVRPPSVVMRLVA